MLTAAELNVADLSLSAWTWIDSTPDGLVAFMLITPASGERRDLRQVAVAAGLATPELPLPAPGILVALADADALVLLPNASGAIRVPSASEWADFVRRGGVITLLIGARPLDAGAGLVGVDEYLMRAVLSRQIWLGKTTLAAEYSAKQCRGEACIVCGHSDPPLAPAGHAYTPTPGAPLGWAIAAHPDCLGSES
ncbi:hypothetical protein ACFXDE_02225 [Kitasatospora sp. NPDC059408]|uniref:hypothetical protein n=1 Tax=Kitasatospora sp. NPDC059408 TaxID=3346823 RepID=UPI0036C3E181